MTTNTQLHIQDALINLTQCSNEELRMLAERREQALIDLEDMLDRARFEGAQKILISQLQHKFGPLPQQCQSQLSQATDYQLQKWSLNALDAQRIEDVFDPA